ncbi:MAG TPA: hypothetical protein VHR39_06080 [Propionibacteriaceae bacterium]|jgi:hypothetical protein|nr:hypothetical protein [Propionibacteriaceae bacterium]
MASELSLTDVSTAIRLEYRRIFTERRDDLVAVSFNALLVTLCWFLLPTNILNWLFTLHGALAFPYFLEMWMLGDTPATNVAGRDAVRAVAQLHDPAALRLWLRAKHLVLASFVGPTAAIVAIVIGLVQHRYEAAAAVAITLLFLPLGVLSVAAWVGLWLPYHPQKLVWRWRHRSDWRAALLRWGLLVFLPFMVVPLIAVMLLIPSLIIWIIAHQGYPPQHMNPIGLWIGTAVAVAVSLIAFAWAPAVASRIARRRYDRLHGYLSNPEHG